MARGKRKLERIESLDRSEATTQVLMPRQDIAYWCDLIERKLAEANPQNRDTRSLSEIISDIENDKNKSQTRKDFEIEIAKMADRMNSKTVTPTSETQGVSDEPLPLYERRKFCY